MVNYTCQTGRKKDRLQLSLQMLRDSWHHCQTTMKDAEQKHLSCIISSNYHKPCVLFKTIDCPSCSAAAICENLLHSFIDKVISTRTLISPSTHDPSISVPCSADFDHFESVSPALLQEIVGHLKSSGCPYDVVTPPLFKEVYCYCRH